MTQTTTADLPVFPFARPAGDPFTPPVGPHGEPIEAPVSRVALPTGRWAWLVTRHEDVRQTLRSNAFSADMGREGFPLLRNIPPSRLRQSAGSFIRMDAPEHTRFRRIVTPEFMTKSMRRLEPLIHRTVTDALAELRAAGQPADLVERFALPVPSIVICHLLGVPYADHDFFQSRSRTLLSRSSSDEAVGDAAQDLRGYLTDLTDAKRLGGGSDDLLGRLTERIGTGELSAEEVVGVGLLLLIAGHETTANMIGLSTLVLLRHPDVFAALPDDQDLATDAVEELLRYLTIVRTGLPRLAIADVEIGGQRIRAGEGVIALLSSANRDGDAFAEPDGFDPRRGANQHVAFGFGVHQCIGQPLARIELRVALVELARRFPGLELAAPLGELPMREDSVVFGVDRMPVRW